MRLPSLLFRGSPDLVRAAPDPPTLSDDTARHGRRIPWSRVVLYAVALAAVPASSAQSASQPGRPVPPALRASRVFQPGVRIDWRARRVVVSGRVVFREGVLEYLACYPGKEHESVVLLDGRAEHVLLALGLVGLRPGTPPRWDEAAERFTGPTGDLIDVRLWWQEDGTYHAGDGFDWLQEYEFGRPPIARPWVFTGSRRLRGGGVAADRMGDGIAVVDKPDALMNLSRSHTESNADLWCLANTPAIPPLGTRVWIVLGAATPRCWKLHADFRGALYADDRLVTPGDAADLIRLARQLSPDRPVPIALRGTLRCDAERLRRALRTAGAEAAAFRFTPRR